MGVLRQRWPALWPFVTALVAGLLAVHRLNDNDLFWHLELGRSVLAEHARTVAEPLALPELGARTIVHEWLWDVTLYVVQRRFGFAGIGALVIGVSMLAGAGLGALVTRWTDGHKPRFFATFGVTSLALGLVAVRLNERPETAAMAFWPFGLLLAKRVAQRGTTRDAVLLVLLGWLWSQTHLSIFAYVPAAFAIIGPTALGDRTRSLALVGLVVGLCANAAGLEIFTVRSRVAGYVAAHVSEWKPLGWALMNPFEPTNVQGPAFLWLLVLGVVAAVARKPPRELLLALLGLLLVLQGRRGASPATFLILPLALGALQRRPLRFMSAAFGVVSLIRLWSWSDPLAKPVLDAAAFPVGAGARLDDGAPHRALTTYRTGPYLSFVTERRVRGFVDSRTPIFTFTDVDLAVARTIWSAPSLPPTAMARFGFDVAVVERDLPVCDALASSPDWKLVLVEPAFSTFAKASTPLAESPIGRVRPCGTKYLDDDACDLEADLARLARYDAAPFVSYLRASRMLRCAAGKFDGDEIARAIPDDAPGFAPQNDALRAWLFALAGRSQEAVSMLEPHVAKGWVWVLDDALPVLVRRGGADPELRALLSPLADGDDADVSIVTALALTCARLHDERCTRVQAARAAALGRLDVVPALCWLTSVPGAREDATRWLQALSQRSPSRLLCP